MTFRLQCAVASVFVLSPATMAQTPPPAAVDLETVQAVVGSWTYRPIAGGSEADFTDSGGHFRLMVRCTRAAGVVTIIRTGVAAAAPLLTVTTSYGARSLSASFAAGNLTGAVAVNAPLLADIAFSRGKWAIANSGEGTLVVPSRAESARVIEDCRS